MHEWISQGKGRLCWFMCLLCGRRWVNGGLFIHLLLWIQKKLYGDAYLSFQLCVKIARQIGQMNVERVGWCTLVTWGCGKDWFDWSDDDDGGDIDELLKEGTTASTPLSLSRNSPSCSGTCRGLFSESPVEPDASIMVLLVSPNGITLCVSAFRPDSGCFRSSRSKSLRATKACGGSLNCSKFWRVYACWICRGAGSWSEFI